MLKSTKKLLFKGCATALVTPMKNGEADLDAFELLVKAQIDAGVSALVVCGTTGEAPTLTERERQKLISRAVKIADGRIPVIAGTGGPCTDKMLRMSWSAKEVGADGLLIVNPYYNKGTDDGIVRSYFAAAEIGLPIILYNVPSRTGTDMSVSLIARLSAHENIVGLKEASTVKKVAAVLASPECDLHVYSGNDEHTFSDMALGARGVVSVASNVIPKRIAYLCALLEEEKYREARELHHSLCPLFYALFEETNPVPVKMLCERLGICLADVRLPLAKGSPALGDKLWHIYTETEKNEK